MSSLYFAYGSNLCLPRLRHRVPGVRPRGPACLRRYELRWHKRSHDGSGKCSIVRGKELASYVHGALFSIPADEKPRLDRVEELGTGYHETEVDVESADGVARAWTYVAAPQMRDDALRPYVWYRDLVAFGAQDLGLPAAYVDALHAVASLEDPDPVRARRERAFLTQLPGCRVRS